jgi:hypothetical protein
MNQGFAFALLTGGISNDSRVARNPGHVRIDTFMDDAFVICKSTPVLGKRCGVDPARRGKILCMKCYQEAK